MPLPGSQYVENPFAERLLQQGSSTAPVSSWTEGLARMASALMGGYLKGQGRKQEDEAIQAMLGGFAPKTVEYDPTGTGPVGGQAQSYAMKGGFEPAIASLQGMEGNQYAGRLAQQLMMQKVIQDQQAEQQAAQLKQTLAGQMALKQAPGWTAPKGPTADMQNYEFAKQNGFQGSFEDWNASGGGGEKFGNTPIWGTDAQGNPVLMQPSSRGGVKRVDLPPGVTPQRGQTSRVDLGDKFGVLDANGALIGYMPKGIGPERKVQDDRILTLPAVPGGPPVGPALSSQQPAPQMPPAGTGMPQPEPKQPAIPPQGAVPGVEVQDLPPTATETRKEDMRKSQQAKYANVVAEDIDRTISMIRDASVPVTGIMGAATKNIPGTPGYQVGRLLDTIKANAGFDRLQEMRAASPTGGALGQVSDFENKLLQATIGNLEQAQDKDELLYNLRRVKDIYLDIIHGLGNRPGQGSSPQNTPPPPAGFSVVN